MQNLRRARERERAKGAKGAGYSHTASHSLVGAFPERIAVFVSRWSSLSLKKRRRLQDDGRPTIKDDRESRREGERGSRLPITLSHLFCCLTRLPRQLRERPMMIEW